MPRIKKSEKRWFTWKEDPDKGKVSFKHLSPGENSLINDEGMIIKTTYVEQENGDMKPIVEGDSNQTALRELPIIKSIEGGDGWKNFFDEDGGVMECNRENIEQSIRRIDGFKEWATKCIKKLGRDIAKEQKAQLKNLQGSAKKPAK